MNSAVLMSAASVHSISYFSYSLWTQSDTWQEQGLLGCVSLHHDHHSWLSITCHLLTLWGATCYWWDPKLLEIRERVSLQITLHGQRQARITALRWAATLLHVFIHYFGFVLTPFLLLLLFLFLGRFSYLLPSQCYFMWPVVISLFSFTSTQITGACCNVYVWHLTLNVIMMMMSCMDDLCKNNNTYVDI